MSKDIAEMQNLSLPFSLIAIPKAAPEQGTRNLDGGKLQPMHVSCTENCHPTTAIMATMWKFNVTSDKFSLPTRSRMWK
jgi:hypothetical protein